MKKFGQLITDKRRLLELATELKKKGIEAEILIFMNFEWIIKPVDTLIYFSDVRATIKISDIKNRRELRRLLNSIDNLKYSNEKDIIKFDVDTK